MSIGLPRTDGEVQAPTFGVLGEVPTDADTTRVDFTPTDFTAQIEAHGKRLAWLRAMRCPCPPLNEQTNQADPTCPSCHGTSVTHFGPGSPQDLPGQTLTAAQRALLDASGAFVIRGVLSGFGKQDKPWDRIGSWRLGAAGVTVRHENRLGFADKLTVLDDRIVFSEVVTISSNAVSALPLRYTVAGGVYRLASAGRVLRAGTDYEVRAGRVRLLRALGQQDRRLGIVYVTFPTFSVVDLPNVSRETSVEDAEGPTQTGIGTSQQLPVRATLRLEFLPALPDPGEP